MYDAYNANREQWQCACTICIAEMQLIFYKDNANREQ